MLTIHLQHPIIFFYSKLLFSFLSSSIFHLPSFFSATTHTTLMEQNQSNKPSIYDFKANLGGA
jgi:hypothetical protein